MKARSMDRPRRRRVLAFAWAFFTGGVLVAATVGVACTGPEPRYFPGASLGMCEGPLARPIPASQCKSTIDAGLDPCTGPTAYALCNGNSYNVCTCELPNGYDLDGGLVDADAEPTLTGLVEFDAEANGLFGLCCTGNIVYELPPSECPARCTGLMAYAVCVDNRFTECTCEMPDGYGFSDLMCDSGDF
jgi:hypothetical protein